MNRDRKMVSMSKQVSNGTHRLKKCQFLYAEHYFSGRQKLRLGKTHPRSNKYQEGNLLQKTQYVRRRKF